MRTIPDPGFPGDDGSASPELVAALAEYDEEPGARHARTLAVLQHARLLVPVLAVLGEAEEDARGIRPEKTSDMATVLMQGRDGRTGLLAFTSVPALARWDPAARPVPVSVADAARAARHDGAAALVVDVAGPVRFVVEEEDLAALAEGYRLVALSGRFGWVRPGR